MASEAIAPDGVLVSTNYSTLNLADIDEDPDSPDGNWGTWAAAGNDATDCRVSFGTPSGNPTTGAGLQEFRVLVKKSATGGADCGYSLELWEDGVQDSVLTTGTCTSDTGVVVSGTWDASSLGTADGSLVECRMLQTSGHSVSPAKNERGLEVGAVEWNCDYSSGSIENGQGEADGSATTTGKGASTAASDGSAAGSATALGDGASTAAADGSVTASATSLGEGASTANGQGTNADGTATTLGYGLGVNTAQGLNADGSATTTGVGAATGDGQALADGVATALGYGASEADGQATADGTATTLGYGTGINVGQAEADGSATTLGYGLAVTTGQGTNADGSATTLGYGAATGDGQAEADGVATALGYGEADANGQGTADGVATALGYGEAVTLGQGVADGSATTLGYGEAVTLGQGTADGVATATAVGATVGNDTGQGIAAGIATALGYGEAVKDAQGIAVGAATVTGVGDGGADIEKTQGIAAGIASVIGRTNRLLRHKALGYIMNRIAGLLDGTATGCILTTVESGTFKHVPFDSEYALPASAAAPYPFEIEDLGEYQPCDVPSTLSPSDHRHGCTLLVRVAYATAPHNAFERLKDIQRGRYEIRKALGHPNNFVNVAGYLNCTVEEGEISIAQLPGSGDYDTMMMLEIPVNVIYH